MAAKELMARNKQYHRAGSSRRRPQLPRRGVVRVDSILLSLLGELRAHEQQAAQELSQWQTRSVVEERKV